MARQNARSASDLRYDGTTTAEWEPPSLSDYAEAMDLEDVETTGDLSAEAKRRIAAMTLMGEARASRFDELQSYPVVEAGGALNRNALEAARRLRGRSQDPAGIERATRQLLNDEFDADIDTPDRSMIPDEAQRAAENGDTLYRSYDVEVRAEGEDDPIVMRFNAGDTTDRHGTRFDMSGADLEAFRSNNVVLWAHGKDRQGRVPIGRAVPRIVDGDLVASLEFDQEDDFARKIESKMRRGFINAGSIGARPLAQPELRTYGESEVPTFPEWELTELSIVAVPSDPEATAVARSDEGGQEEDRDEQSDLKRRLDELEQRIEGSEETRAVSVDSLRRSVRQAVYDMDGPQENWYCKEVVVDSLTDDGASGSVVAYEREAEQAYRMQYTYDGDEVMLADRDSWTEVEQTWEAVSESERALKTDIAGGREGGPEPLTRREATEAAASAVAGYIRRRADKRNEQAKELRQTIKKELGKA